MATKEVIVFIAIHLIVPLIGLTGFLYVARKIKQNKIEKSPVFELFIVFATYGGLLLVTLTTLFWFWSSMASLGTFYLIIGAPIVMGIIAYRNRKVKDISKYHLFTYRAGLLYFIIAPIIFLILIAFGNKG